MEKDTVVIDMIIIIIMFILFQEIILDIRKISLMVLIVGGAEILTAININHQNVMFGDILIIPLNKDIFRE